MSKSGDVAVRQFIAVLNDADNNLKTSLFQRLNGDLKSRVLPIKNEYFQANVGVKDFDNAEKVIEAINHEKIIPALIFVYTRGFPMDKIAAVFGKDKAETSAISEMSKIVICDNEFECMNTFDLDSWSSKNFFDVVYLNPTEVQKAECEKNNEQYGFARIKEILDCTSWPIKDTIMEKISGNLELDRVLKYVYDMEDSGEDDSSLSPDSEAEEEIWRAFEMPQSLTPNLAPSPEPMHAERVHLTSSSPTETDATATSNVSLDVEIVAKKPDQAGSNISNQPIANTISASNVNNQNKKKKKKKSKGGAGAAPGEN